MSIIIAAAVLIYFCGFCLR